MPPPSQQWSQDIDGVLTEFVVTIFSNRFVIAVSQIGKISTVILAETATKTADPSDTSEADIRTKQLLGCRHQLPELCARQMVARLGVPSVLLCLGLQREVAENMRVYQDILVALVQRLRPRKVDPV